jgi:putative flippase GtrA
MNKQLKDILINKSNKLVVQLLRYTFVGGLAFIVDFGLLFLLTEFAGLYYLASATCSFLAGLLVNYYISTIWVFGSSPYKKGMEFLLFAIIGIIGLGLNDVLIWVFTEKAGLYYMLSKLLTAVLVYLWNFLGRRYLIFNKEK